MALSRLKGFIRSSFTIIGGITVVSCSGAYVLYSSAQKRKRQQAVDSFPKEFILGLDLEEVDLTEYMGQNFLAQALGQGKPQMDLHKVVDALTAAGGDPRVQGLAASIGADTTFDGLAQVQELRNAVNLFRLKSRGPAGTMIFSDSFGEGGAGGSYSYYLASAFEKVYMQPTGLVSFIGLSSTTPFLRGLLDRWDVKALFFAREKYKNAANIFTEKNYTDAHREATSQLLEGFVRQMVAGVAESRSLTPEKVRAALDQGPLTSEQAISHGLVDQAMYRDQALASMLGERAPRQLTAHQLAAVSVLLLGPDTVAAPREIAPAVKEAVARRDADAIKRAENGPVAALEGVVKAQDPALGEKGGADGKLETTAQKQLPLVKMADYIKIRDLKRALEQNTAFLKILKSVWEKKEESNLSTLGGKSPQPVIAVVTASGSIVLGKGTLRKQAANQEIASLPMCELLDKLRDDPTVWGVVVRVDSPGGSAVASESIYRSMQRLKEAGKPVVVSMGNVAASGGYYISAPATKIVAQPGTITGSIGVIFGKFNIAGLLRGQGINPETVSVGKNSASLGGFSDFQEEQKAQINHVVDGIYGGFISQVAAGRGMSKEEVAKVAGGRVWTGEDALKAGLVDQLGGLQDAITLALQAASLPIGAESEGLVRVVQVPEPVPALVQIVQALKDGSSNGTLGQALAGVASTDAGMPETIWRAWREISKGLELQSGAQMVSEVAAAMQRKN